MKPKPITRRPHAAGTALAFTLGTVLLSAPAAGAAEQQCRAGVCAPGQPTAEQSRQPDSALSIRHIELEGAVNFRDVGGYATDTGGTVRQGLVYRSDALNELTDTDLATVSGLHLKEVVDFRRLEESEGSGADKLPDGLTPTPRPVGKAAGFSDLRDVIAHGTPEEQNELLGNGKAAEHMRATYRAFVTDEEDRKQFAATLRDIADGGEDALLYHCAGGKDRTGWMTYVLLRALSVPHETAEQDYLATNGFRKESNEEVLEQLKNVMKNPALVVPIQVADADYLRAATDEVTKSYGNLDAYLKRGLELDEDVLERLKQRLVV